MPVEVALFRNRIILFILLILRVCLPLLINQRDDNPALEDLDMLQQGVDQFLIGCGGTGRMWSSLAGWCLDAGRPRRWRR